MGSVPFQFVATNKVTGARQLLDLVQGIGEDARNELSDTGVELGTATPVLPLPGVCRQALYVQGWFAAPRSSNPARRGG